MAKRWSLKDDLFLVHYFDAVGDMCGTHDLGRPSGAATNRVKRLKETGAWTALKNMQRSQRDYLRRYHEALGNQRESEMLDLTDDDQPSQSKMAVIDGGRA